MRINYIILLFLAAILLPPKNAAAQEVVVLYPDTSNLISTPGDSSLFILPIRVLNFQEIAGVDLVLEFNPTFGLDSIYFAEGINTLGNPINITDNVARLVLLELSESGASLADNEVFFYVQFRPTGNIGDCYSITFNELEVVLSADPGTPTPSMGINATCLQINLSLSGSITYASANTGLPDVSVDLVSQDTTLTVLTDSMGQYRFDDVMAPAEYTLLPIEKTDETNRAQRLRGVNVLDLLAIQDHLLGRDTLASPYQYVAADIDTDGNIATSDLLRLQTYIVARIDTFPDNTYWRFINANHAFDPLAPLGTPLPESISIETQLGSQTNLNFRAVKTADVNLDAY